MRLAEALQIVARPSAAPKHVYLLCGFQPLHLAAFITAHVRLRFPESGVALHTGLYGDLEGNIERASQGEPAEGALVFLEWADLDPRLGFRSTGGWAVGNLQNIATQVRGRCRRLLNGLASLSAVTPVTVAGPTLALPPLTHTPPAQASGFELQLGAVLAEFLQEVSLVRGLTVLNASALAMTSPQTTRHDLKMELQAGFPYTLAHADALAQLAVNCLFAREPKKGLITDLDNTLWKGILGDVGAEGVSWSLDEKTQAHALYQQMLASLAESGVLLAIASKNDPQLVKAALSRQDLLVSPSQVFPIEASWGAKSDAVERILEAWNVGADSVVFVDDSPMELAEVAEKHPDVECLRFPNDDVPGMFTLLQQLRERFGKQEVKQEDRMRLETLRSSVTAKQEREEQTAESFIASLGATITLQTVDAENTRALELVNKTNQFNLNGKRYTEAEWRSRAKRPGAFTVVVDYQDRFGPLGRIAVLGGSQNDDRCRIDVWVMSCRAFSRQIEFQILRFLFSELGVAEVCVDFRPTERNGPLRTVLQHFVGPEKATVEGDLTLSAETFWKNCPILSHEVINHWTMLPVD